MRHPDVPETLDSWHILHRLFRFHRRPFDELPEECRADVVREAGAYFAPLAASADGDVSLVMMLDLETEVEMKLPGRFKVSPQIAGAIKAVSGVVDVQTL